ncbi:hypothetical protein PPSIR1_26408 [Plesiocystis pacifica SIR-1]|uniref:Uncharacterized protein n=2 Tax=Plesiocystis pacifica TaxID=191768 RepID=A6G9Z2_9BACT|nr:hypothetical protein PPSIR1_26408 [Plesiocystis pacifica SIR-1]
MTPSMLRTPARVGLPALALLTAFALLPAESRANLQDPPERVVMGLDEFLNMYEQAKGTKDTPEQPPRHYALSSAAYAGEVLIQDGEPRFARFDATLRVEVLRKEGWVRVPVLPATVALHSAKVKGKEASIVIENGFYTLITDQKGAFDLELDFGASVSTTNGQSQVAFELAGSGATTLALSVPSEEDLDFTVANAHLQSDETANGTRKVEATLPSTGTLMISWQREIPEAAVQQQAQVYAEVYTLVGISDGLMRATTTVEHTILFAGKDKLEFQVPEGMTLVDVEGVGLRDWKHRDDGVLEVLLNYAAEGNYSLTMTSERPVGAKGGDLSAPIVKPLGVERAKGWLGVESRGNLEIRSGEVVQATAVDVRSLPGAILGLTKQPVLLGYKYLNDQASVPLQIQQHADVDVLVTLLDETQAQTMWTPEGRRLTSVNYQVRNNRKQFLRLTLPEGAELWSASVGGRAVQPASAPDGRVLVPLVRSQSTGGALAAFDVEVVYVENGEPVPASGKGTFSATLPTPDVPSTYVAWTIYTPDRTRIKRKSYDGSLAHVDWLSNPIPDGTVAYIETVTPEVQQQANVQSDTGGLGEGAVPVPVSLPLQGTPVYFEKLLALDETLEVSFDFKGLKRR